MPNPETKPEKLVVPVYLRDNRKFDVEADSKLTIREAILQVIIRAGAATITGAAQLLAHVDLRVVHHGREVSEPLERTLLSARLDWPNYSASRSGQPEADKFMRFVLHCKASAPEPVRIALAFKPAGQR